MKKVKFMKEILKDKESMQTRTRVSVVENARGDDLPTLHKHALQFSLRHRLWKATNVQVCSFDGFRTWSGQGNLRQTEAGSI